MGVAYDRRTVEIGKRADGRIAPPAVRVTVVTGRVDRIPGETPLAQTWNDSPVNGGGTLRATLTLGIWTSSLDVTTATSGVYDSQFQWACTFRPLGAVNRNSVTGTVLGDVIRTCAVWEGTMTGIVGMIDDL